MNTDLLPAFAKAIAEHFPDLNGRAFAVAEVEPFKSKTYKPTLPVAVVALMGETSDQPLSGRGETKLTSEVVVQFIYDPVKYTSSDGQDTPFWAYYSYTALRDQMLELLDVWRTPSNTSMAYRSLDVTSDEFAVYITLRFETRENWCTATGTSASEPVMIISNQNLIARTVQPAAKCCIPCDEPVDPCDTPTGETTT